MTYYLDAAEGERQRVLRQRITAKPRRTMNAQQSRRFLVACQELQRLSANAGIVALLRSLAA